VLEIAPEQGLDAVRLMREGREGILDRGDQVGEGGEVAVVGGGPFGGAPEELNRVVIWRVAGQVDDVQAVAVLREEGLDRRGAMVGRAILDQEQRFGGLLGGPPSQLPPDR